MANIQDFSDFTNNILNDNTLTRHDNDDGSIHMLDGITAYTMCNSKNRANIYNIRKHWFVDNYLKDENHIKQPYLDFYEQNIKDTFPGNFNPPSSFQDLLNNQKEHDEIVEYNDDVAFHYDDLSNRYNRYLEAIKEKQQKNENIEIDEMYNDSDTNSSYTEEDLTEYEDDFDTYYDDYEDYEEDYDDYNDW